MSKQTLIVLIAIVLIMVLGFSILKSKPEDINRFDTPTTTPSPTPRHNTNVPLPIACYNEDGIEVPCKG